MKNIFFHSTILSTLSLDGPGPDGLVVSVSDSLPGGCEFDTQLGQTFFQAYFRRSPLKHVRKVVDGFREKVVLVLV